MENIIKKLNSFYKAAIKKLNNFRLTAVILSAVNLVAGIVALGLTFCFYFAGDVWEAGSKSRVPSFMGLDIDFNTNEMIGVGGRFMGMVFFLACIVVIGLSIAVIYNSLPSIKNKEKVTPKRSILMFAFVNGCFQVVVFVFSILAIALESPNTIAGYIVSLPLTFISMAANLLAIVPFLKCIFYQPAVGSKLIQKKAKAE